MQHFNSVSRKFAKDDIAESEQSFGAGFFGLECAQLIEKYSGAGPRYTSYPTAVEFVASEGFVELWSELLKGRAVVPPRGLTTVAPSSLSNGVIGRLKDGRSHPASGCGDQGYALYLHIPFCQSLCYYCACNKMVTKDRGIVAPYLNALRAELTMYRRLLGDNIAIDQIHWGGGTPNYLTPEEMRSLHGMVLETFPNLSPSAEVSAELDPRTVTHAHLSELRALGFNRVSFGIQDFDAEVQRIINREQSFELVSDVYTEARRLGFSGINFDLIYGLPEQTATGFLDTVRQTIELTPDRVALYGYAHVTWREKVQRSFERAHLPSPSERLELFRGALSQFLEAGYRYIGFDHFALPDDELSRALDAGTLNRNFMGYSTHAGTSVIGIGASAISSLPEGYAQNVKDVRTYMQRISDGTFAIERGLHRTWDDALRGHVIESVLCQGVVSFSDFESMWGVKFEEYFSGAGEELRRLERDGIVELESGDTGWLRVTSIGRLFLRQVAMCIDAYYAKHRDSGRKVFSQGV